MVKRITVDETRCLACRSCMIECALAHSAARSLVEALSGPIPPQPRVHVEAVGKFGMPLQCRHCQDAPCITACPTKVIHRLDPTGHVLIDGQRCIGCAFCVTVCPFGMVEMSRDGKGVVKCDECIERTRKGEPPACVAACPTGAIRFREIDDWLAERRRLAAEQIAAARDPGDPGAAEK